MKTGTLSAVSLGGVPFLSFYGIGHVLQIRLRDMRNNKAVTLIILVIIDLVAERT